MKRIFRLLFSFGLMFLPSPAKVLALRLSGSKIGRQCKIGFSFIDAELLELGDYVRIGNFNILKSLVKLSMDDGSKIESFNWITGGLTGEHIQGRNSSICRFHFFEASGSVYIGSNTIIAGRSSLFFTHGIAPDALNDVRSIKIGSWCYVGAATRFLPGSSVADGTFVGMGAVVTREFSEQYCLVAGVPARVVKKLDRTAAFFDRPALRHLHHPATYSG